MGTPGNRRAGGKRELAALRGGQTGTMRHRYFLTPVFIHVDNNLPFHAAFLRADGSIAISETGILPQLPLTKD